MKTPNALTLTLIAALLAGCLEEAGPDAGGPAGGAPATGAPSGTLSTAPAPAPVGDPVQLVTMWPGPTVNATVTVEGGVDRATTLSVLVSDRAGTPVTASLEADVDAGPFTLEVPLPRVGQNWVQVVAGVGADQAVAAATLVHLGTYTLAVDYGGYPGASNTNDTVTMDPDALLSAPDYEEQGAAHPGTPIVHDLLVAWGAATGGDVEYGWSDEFDAYSVTYINGAGNPVDSALPPWWCYRVNGERAGLGISLQPVAPGDAVAWDLGACA